MLEKRRRVQIEQPDAIARLAEHLKGWLARYDFRDVGFYRPIRGEPDLTAVFTEWVAEGSCRRLCVPLIDDVREGRMHYGVWNAERVCPGVYGIEEPQEDVPAEPDVIFSPCVGLTREGYRLGNGGGFFDRWLAQRVDCANKPVTVAVGFDCLMMETFVPMPFDIPMDWILTESGIKKAAVR